MCTINIPGNIHFYYHSLWTGSEHTRRNLILYPEVHHNQLFFFVHGFNSKKLKGAIMECDFQPGVWSLSHLSGLLNENTVLLHPQALAAWNLNFVIEELMESVIKQLISSYSNSLLVLKWGAFCCRLGCVLNTLYRGRIYCNPTTAFMWLIYSALLRNQMLVLSVLLHSKRVSKSVDFFFHFYLDTVCIYFCVGQCVVRI